MADDKSKTSKEELAKINAQKIAKASTEASAENFGKFFKDTLVELKKTTWPDQNTLQKSTLIVLAFIFATAIWVGAIDKALTTIQQHAH